MNFVKGMDLSTLAELEKCGAKYYDNGEEKDLLEIMKSYDVDTIRIRVWNDPWSEAGESYGAGENDPKTSLEIAKRVTKAGFGVLLNLHYSDFWADPGKQFKPKAWESYGVKELEQAVYDFTLEMMHLYLASFRSIPVTKHQLQQKKFRLLYFESQYSSSTPMFSSHLHPASQLPYTKRNP